MKVADGVGWCLLNLVRPQRSLVNPSISSSNWDQNKNRHESSRLAATRLSRCSKAGLRVSRGGVKVRLPWLPVSKKAQSIWGAHFLFSSPVSGMCWSGRGDSNQQMPANLTIGRFPAFIFGPVAFAIDDVESSQLEKCHRRSYIKRRKQGSANNPPTER